MTVRNPFTLETTTKSKRKKVKNRKKINPAFIVITDYFYSRS